MRGIWWLVIMLFLPLSLAAQQTNDTCPAVTIVGPSGIVKPGEIATYTVKIDPRGLNIKPVIKWTAVSADILSGQGTDKVEIRNPTAWNTTVKVEVEGFPVGCPNLASETGTVSVDPGPIKLLTIKGPLDNANFTGILDAAKRAPNAQIYIFLSGSARNTAKSIQRKQNAVTNGLKQLHGNSRITFVRLTTKDDNAVFWLIPPGVTPPAP